MRGGAKPPPYAGSSEVFWSWFGSAIGIGLCGFFSSLWFEPYDMTLIIGSFGASAVLVYAAIKSPLAQPRNLMGGHIISAVLGVFCYKIFGAAPWVAASLAVSFAIAAMLITNTLHPPGGATALIAVIGSPTIHDLGYFYAVAPVGLGALILLVVALIVNNIAPARRYPEFWF
ncbi:MAG: membrane protein [bacterium]|nr:MAG: membrane protein [bacterium]